MRTRPHAWPPRTWGTPGAFLLSRHPAVGGGLHKCGPGYQPYVWADLAVHGRTVRVAALHPPHAAPGHLHLQRDAMLAFAARHPAERPAAYIVAGDLNLTVHHPMFAAFVRAAGVYAAGPVGTWPAHPSYVLPGAPAVLDGPGLRIGIDHVLVDSSVAVLGIRAGSDTGSDHRAVYARLVLTDPGDPVVTWARSPPRR